MLVKENQDNLKEVYQKARDGDEYSRTYLIELHKPLIYSLLKKYKVLPSEKEDLYQCALIGLINAINKFDFAYDTQFSTYAVPLILGEIKKYFRDNNLISVSRNIKDNYKKIVNYENSCNDKSPTIEEIMHALNLSREEVLEALEANTYCYSLDTPLEIDNSITLLDTISSNEEVANIDLSLALASLSKKERLIIELRYFEGLSQKEVASRMYLNQVAISRLEKKILEKLKKEYIK